MAYQKSVLVPRSQDDTFALITQPDQLRRWHAITARVDLRVGGGYRLTVVPGSSAAGAYTEVEGGKRVAFSWGWEGSVELPPGASTVHITLEPTDGGTLVSLVHDGLTAGQAASHGEGWDHYLGRLASAGAGGDTGPDIWHAGSRELGPIAVAEASLAACQFVLRGINETNYDRRVRSCPDYTVAQLADHLIGSVTFFGTTAGANMPEPHPVGAGDRIEARIADPAQVALEAWNGRGTDGTVRVRGDDVPASIAVGILTVEFLVHAWDFAAAMGHPVIVSDQVAAQVLDSARMIITPQIRSGRFADALHARADAGVLSQLIAFTGRTA